MFRPDPHLHVSTVSELSLQMPLNVKLWRQSLDSYLEYREQKRDTLYTAVIVTVELFLFPENDSSQTQTSISRRTGIIPSILLTAEAAKWD